MSEQPAPPPSEEQPPAPGPLERHRACGPAAIGFVVVTGLLVVVFVAVLYPLYSMLRGQSLVRHNVETLREVGLAVAVYASDYDDRLPPVTSSLDAAFPAMRTYLKGQQRPKSVHPSGKGFAGDPSLGGQAIAAIDRPKQKLLFFDAEPWSPVSVRTVLTVSGEAPSVTDEVFEQAQANKLTLPATR